MPNFSYECDYCNDVTVVNRKISERDDPIAEPCKHCGRITDRTRAHCEAKNVDTHFPGAHRLEYGALNRRKGY